LAAIGVGWLLAGRVLRPLSTITAAARRISASSLTVDYATQTTAADFQMPCRGGAPACRLVITGNDWQLPQCRDRCRRPAVRVS
jgi:hypothetical protein